MWKKSILCLIYILKTRAGRKFIEFFGTLIESSVLPRAAQTSSISFAESRIFRWSPHLLLASAPSRWRSRCPVSIGTKNISRTAIIIHLPNRHFEIINLQSTEHSIWCLGLIVHVFAPQSLNLPTLTKAVEYSSPLLPLRCWTQKMMRPFAREG